MAKSYLLMGSNLGSRAKLLQEAVSLLEKNGKIKVLRTSKIYETEPWGVKNQNKFLNIAVETETILSPQELLSHCQNIEKQLGRNREKETRWGERTLDIDIIFYDTKIIETKLLSVPHVLMHKREFVLKPLADLIPDFVHPVLKKSVKELYDKLEKTEEISLYEPEKEPAL